MSEFTPKDGVPLGKRFDHLYVERGEAASDSPRMRHRLAQGITEFGEGFQKYAEAELGIPTPWSTARNWRYFLSDWQISDVLSVTTLAYRFLDRHSQESRARAWQFLVNRIFEEENVTYRMDKAGGVHHFVDEEFTRNAAATISSLESARYKNVRNEFEASLSSVGKDNKTAIRRTFASAEGLYRLMYTKAPRLTAAEVDQLTTKLQKIYLDQPAAVGATTKIVASFKDWIDACHFFRHEPGQEEIAQPPLNLTLLLVSIGAAYIRLLAEIDKSPA